MEAIEKHSPLSHIAELTSCAFSTYTQCYLSESRPATWPRPCLCPMLCPQKWTWCLCSTWFPLTFSPPLSLPSEADLLLLLHGQSPQPCKIKNRKARCSEEGGCEEGGEKCVLLKMKESWAQKGLPLKERDDDIVKIISKVKQRLQSVKKNLKKMSSETKEKHSRTFSSTTVNLAPGNFQEVIKSNWHLPQSIKKSLLAVLDDYLGKNATR